MSGELDSAVLLVTGVMASGKSTVAELLARRLPRAAHVRGDVFRRMVVSGREDPLPEPSEQALAQLRLRHRLSASTADLYAAEGWTAVVQDIVLGPELADWAGSVRTRPLYVVVLTPSPDVVRERERSRPKSGYAQGAWTVEALDAVLREHTPRLGLWLDSSDLTPDQTVSRILGDLEAARI